MGRDDEPESAQNAAALWQRLRHAPLMPGCDRPFGAHVEVADE